MKEILRIRLLWEQHRVGEVPTCDHAKKILADYDAGHVILAPICEPGAIDRLRAIAAGGEVDPSFFHKRGHRAQVY